MRRFIGHGFLQHTKGMNTGILVEKMERKHKNTISQNQLLLFIAIFFAAALAIFAIAYCIPTRKDKELTELKSDIEESQKYFDMSGWKLGKYNVFGKEMIGEQYGESIMDFDRKKFKAALEVFVDTIELGGESIDKLDKLLGSHSEKCGKNTKKLIESIETFTKSASSDDVDSWRLIIKTFLTAIL